MASAPTRPPAIIPRPPRAQRSQYLLRLAGVAVVVAAIWAIIAVLRPLPPRTVTMATGPEGGAYHQVGERYRELLARHGVTLLLVPTAGALENAARLRDSRSGIQVALLQGGITNEKESPELESLGTMFYEPLWFFSRGAVEARNLAALRGRKISIGPEGSGGRALVQVLLGRLGIDERFAQLLPLTPQAAADALTRGEIDAALMLVSWESPVVRRLLADERIRLVSFPRADTYVALYPYLSKLTLPAGIGDLAKNRPPTSVALFAPKASLVVRRDLHPALQSLLLDAAEQVHSGPGVFNQAGQFPAAEVVDLPLSDEARQYYRSGRPFLQRHLPFWLAVAIGRLILLIPLLGVLYPLFRFLPAVYAWEVRWRIVRMYRNLQGLEDDATARGPGQPVDDLNKELDRLEEKARNLRVPLFYADALYTLRMHIALVRDRLGPGGARPAVE